MTNDNFIGTWVVGDNVSQARLKVTDNDGTGWGTAVALGYDVSLEVRKAGQSTLLTTISGTWEDANEEAALFTIGDVSLLEPAAGLDSQEYEALLLLEKLSAVQRLGVGNDPTRPFRFKVRQWP